VSTGDDFEKAGDPIAEAIGVLLWQETCFIFLRKFFQEATLGDLKKRRN
jgi:hypothetical protein